MTESLAQELSRIAHEIEKSAASEGRVEQILKQHWQMLHEFEGALSRALTDWKFALDVAEGPEKKVMKDLVKKGESLAKKLDDIARKDIEPVLHLERRVMNMTDGVGPEDYQDIRRGEMYPR